MRMIIGMMTNCSQKGRHCMHNVYNSSDTYFRVLVWRDTIKAMFQFFACILYRIAWHFCGVLFSWTSWLLQKFSLQKPRHDSPERRKWSQTNFYSQKSCTACVWGKQIFYPMKITRDTTPHCYIEYIFADEKFLQLSQISRKIDSLRSNYWVLARIVCIY